MTTATHPAIKHGDLVQRMDRDGLWRVVQIQGTHVLLDPIDGRLVKYWASVHDCIKSDLER